jgi:hypothetical protein
MTVKPVSHGSAIRDEMCVIRQGFADRPGGGRERGTPGREPLPTNPASRDGLGRRGVLGFPFRPPTVMVPGLWMNQRGPEPKVPRRGTTQPPMRVPRAPVLSRRLRWDALVPRQAIRGT